MKNNIKIKHIENQDCTGCSACSSVCPTKAIKMELTKDGFYEPSIDDNKCISCGICKKVCYKFDTEILESNDKEYSSLAAKNLNDEELKTSTSGGVSIELMREAINKGYKVVGVAYDYEQNIAITKIAESISELGQFKGSKYFQSFTEDALNKIFTDKSEQKYAFFGTPCQIYSVAKFAKIKKNREKYLLVDLFCHGCPSLNLWSKYLEESKKKFNVQNFENIEFRSKVHGWHEYGFKFSTKNNNYKSNRLNDEFYELFFDKNIFASACYSCKLRNTLAFTDIRMGDYWGPQYDTDIKGVSAVILTTDIGKEFWKNINLKFDYKMHTFEETVEAQSYGKVHNLDVKKRNETLEILASAKEIKEIAKVYRKSYSNKKKIKKYSKNIIKLLPKSIYFRVKKIMHSM